MEYDGERMLMVIALVGISGFLRSQRDSGARSPRTQTCFLIYAIDASLGHRINAQAKSVTAVSDLSCV